jgi:hypothetical protein
MPPKQILKLDNIKMQYVIVLLKDDFIIKNWVYLLVNLRKKSNIADIKRFVEILKIFLCFAQKFSELRRFPPRCRQA